MPWGRGSALANCLSVLGSVSRAGDLRCVAEVVLGSLLPTVVPYSMQSLSCTGQPSQGAMSSYTPDSALKEVGRLVE